MAGCKQQSIAQVEVRGSYSLGLLEVIAKALDVRLEWLRTGAEPMESPPEEAVRKGNARLMPAPRRRPVPVVSYATAGKAGDYEDLANFLDESLETDCADPNCFALIVEGDSMEPMLRAGDRVVVTPNTEARSGDIVVARREATHEVFVKLAQFAAGGRRVTFKSCNPAYPPLECSRKEFRFIYPVHSMQRHFRHGR